MANNVLIVQKLAYSLYVKMWLCQRFIPFFQNDPLMSVELKQPL